MAHDAATAGPPRRGARLAPLAFVIAALTVPALHAQFRSRIDIVQVTVSVTDANGRLIPNLTRDDFQVWEDGEPQQVTQFTDQRVPVSLGVLLDASDSMRGQPIVDARAALDRFVGELLEPEDEAFVATFNHLPRLAARWRRPPSALSRALDGLQPSGGTAIWDALVGTAMLFERRTHARAAFVVISDGADTASDRTLHQAVDAIRRTDTFVYAIAIDDAEARESSRVNPEALREITSLSGGYTEVVKSAADLGPATARIADELNTQYTLGYSSSRAPDGSWRALRVRTTRGGSFVRARRGYYAEAARR
jgi:Ca-activated chloride channel family protein